MHEPIRRWLPPRVADLEVRPQDFGDYDDGDGGRTNYYSWYRWVANIVRPRVVCEIGVRLGYSAWCLAVRGVTETFIGFDNESYIAGSNGAAKEMLARVYSRVLLHTCDTQRLDTLENFLQGFVPEVFHVDGNHSSEGCLHDLLLAEAVLPIGGVLIVDDASPGKAPADACQEFLRRHSGYAVLTLNDRLSYMGHHIMIRLE